MKVAMTCDTEITNEKEWMELFRQLHIIAFCKAQKINMSPNISIALQTQMLYDTLWITTSALNGTTGCDEKLEKIREYLNTAFDSFLILKVIEEKL